MKQRQECRLLDLGRVDYLKAFALQKDIVAQIREGRSSHALIACEHPSVITFTRRSNKENIFVEPSQLEKEGVGLCCVDRGGEVTYHGPGQIVLYPIFDLARQKKDLHLYLRRLEQVVINALRCNFGLNAYRLKGKTGVWVGPYKVASIGIAVRGWVAYHGLSLNVKTDKKFFTLIRSCGMDVKMASLNDFFGDEVSMSSVQQMLIHEIEQVFELKIK